MRLKTPNWHSLQCKFVRAANRELITSREEIVKRWEEYFKNAFAARTNTTPEIRDSCETDQNTNPGFRRS